MDETKKIILAIILLCLIFGSATFLGGWKLGMIQAGHYWNETVSDMEERCLFADGYKPQTNMFPIINISLTTQNGSIILAE